jgi:hypothetical protein
MNFLRAILVITLITAFSSLCWGQDYSISFGPTIEACVGQHNVAIPIILTNSQPVEYIHLVISFDPSLMVPQAIAPAIFFQGVNFNTDTPGTIIIELQRDLVPPPVVPPIPAGDTIVAYISMDITVNDIGSDISAFLNFNEDPNTPYPDNLLLLENGYFIITPQLTLEQGEVYIFLPLYGDLNLNTNPYEIGDVVTFVNYFMGLIPFGPRQMANSDCNRDNLQATISDLVFMLRVINSEGNPKLAPQVQPIAADALYNTLNQLNKAPIISLDNPAFLSIFLECKEPLGGFAFTLKLPESVSQTGNVVLGESASALLLASYKTRDTLKIVGYSLEDENLPAGRIELLRIPFESSGILNTGDFKVVASDFSNGQGGKIEVAYEFRMAGATGIDNNTDDALPLAFTAKAYPNPFNSNAIISFAMPEAGQANVEIYDVLGRKVTTLSEGMQAAGEHSIVWNGKDQSGKPIATGIYLCRIKTSTEDRVLKLQYLK